MANQSLEFYCDPAAVAAPSGYIGVFTGSQSAQSSSRLIEGYFIAGSGWHWTDHGVPPNSTDVVNPAAVAAPSGYVGVKPLMRRSPCAARDVGGMYFQLLHLMRKSGYIFVEVQCSAPVIDWQGIAPGGPLASMIIW